MNHVISLSEIIGTFANGERELYASAEADYDPSAGRVSVELKAVARHPISLSNGVFFSWLPKTQTVKEHVPREDASAFARDVFHTWTRKVRQSVPPELPFQHS